MMSECKNQQSDVLMGSSLPLPEGELEGVGVSTPFSWAARTMISSQIIFNHFFHQKQFSSGSQISLPKACKTTYSATQKSIPAWIKRGIVPILQPKTLQKFLSKAQGS